MGELKLIIDGDKKELTQHLLETEEYREKFYTTDVGKLATASAFKVKVR